MKTNIFQKFKQSSMSYKQMASFKGGRQALASLQEEKEIETVHYCIETDGIIYACVTYTDGELDMIKNANWCIA
ncbi:hypothetical protein BKI52_34195 [marine bacterium AO1-C]|nr:hypothetical protein BKI52_34195 [marine bacterium AO1-C]